MIKHSLNYLYNDSDRITVMESYRLFSISYELWRKKQKRFDGRILFNRRFRPIKVRVDSAVGFFF